MRTKYGVWFWGGGLGFRGVYVISVSGRILGCISHLAVFLSRELLQNLGCEIW